MKTSIDQLVLLAAFLTSLTLSLPTEWLQRRGGGPWHIASWHPIGGSAAADTAAANVRAQGAASLAASLRANAGGNLAAGGNVATSGNTGVQHCSNAASQNAGAAGDAGAQATAQGAGKSLTARIFIS